jgi:hypothetical protein
MYLIFHSTVQHIKMHANISLSVRLDMCTTTFPLRKDSIGCKNMYQTQSGWETSSTNSLKLHSQ